MENLKFNSPSKMVMNDIYSVMQRLNNIFFAVTTGEEDEDTIYSVRGKLFSLDDNSWKEKGTGLLKLNVKREDGTGARLGTVFFSKPTCQSHVCCIQ